jgi:hypothetical protein
MNRSIETRLKRLEEHTVPETPPPKVNWIFKPLGEDDADPGVLLTPLEADSPVSDSEFAAGESFPER